MLIKNEVEPFNSDDYIFELKLDGIRGIIYLDNNTTELRNKRNKIMNSIFPELMQVNKNAKQRCILDGEYVILRNGKPDFYELQRRSLMSNKFKIEQAAKKLPVIFVAYDILYANDRQVTDLPLLERKALLSDAINETPYLSVSRYITGNGIEFYNLSLQQDLEGIVAKVKDSKYYIGKQTKDWIKIKNLKDDDYVVCGYISKEQGITSIVLGQYDDNRLIYKGHVTLGVSNYDFIKIKSTPKINTPYFKEIPKGNENTVWVEPVLVCTVKYMMKTDSGGLRQPVFKGLRDDKVPDECIVK